MEQRMTYSDLCVLCLSEAICGMISMSDETKISGESLQNEQNNIIRGKQIIDLFLHPPYSWTLMNTQEANVDRPFADPTVMVTSRVIVIHFGRFPLACLQKGHINFASIIAHCQWAIIDVELIFTY